MRNPFKKAGGISYVCNKIGFSIDAASIRYVERSANRWGRWRGWLGHGYQHGQRGGAVANCNAVRQHRDSAREHGDATREHYKSNQPGLDHTQDFDSRQHHPTLNHNSERYRIAGCPMQHNCRDGR
jgi:hypothetical protein